MKIKKIFGYAMVILGALGLLGAILDADAWGLLGAVLYLIAGWVIIDLTRRQDEV